MRKTTWWLIAIAVAGVVLSVFYYATQQTPPRFNLPREKVALRLMPVKPAAGKFRTAGKGEDLTVSPDNAARYAPYMQLATGIDSMKLVALYVRFYPLFPHRQRQRRPHQGEAARNSQ